MFWKDWAGYYAVCSYDTCHEQEYWAVRQSAGLIDVTPLFKYDVSGPDAAEFLAFVTTRNVQKLGKGRVGYCTWTDTRGHMLDDGTITHLRDDYYRITSADPMLHWFLQYSRGFDVTVDDISEKMGALALQGPTSRAILRDCVDGADLDALKFFRAAECQLSGHDIVVTRTGYTGDLGYEIWVNNDGALDVYDALMEAGAPHLIHPLGLDALDVLRVEAGFVMAGVDYRSAWNCLEDHQKSSPFELGLGWTVHVDREPFIGQRALARDKAEGTAWSFVGLVISWEEIEELHDALDLPPALPSAAWRSPTPVYDEGRQVGYACSGAWSPILKQNLALASVPSKYAEPGTELQFEVTVEFFRKTVTAVVTKTPFYNPPRKRS